MSLAVTHLNTLEQVLRWAVVGFGVTAIVVGLIRISWRETRSFQVLYSYAVVIIALGIMLNYSTRTPVVIPGAFFYITAYVIIIVAFVEEAHHRRRRREKET